MTEKSIVLITGTTSGVGLGLLEHYSALGHQVICVNRRDSTELAARFPVAQFHNVNIASEAEVIKLMSELKSAGRFPSLFFLNAGINKPDNDSPQFNLKNYRENLETNLFGTLTFVSGAQYLGAKNVTFVGISSTSNIVANPGHFGYFLSKLGVLKAFSFIAKADPANSYKTVVLGPLNTSIQRDYGGPATGFQKRLYKLLARDVTDFIPAVAAFVTSRRTVLYYPVPVCVFYWCLKLLLALMPSLYEGTKNRPQTT